MHSPHFGRASSRMRRVLFRLGVLLVGAVLVLALAADHRTGVHRSALAPLTALSAAAPVLAMSVWAVRRWRSDPRILAAAGAVAGAVSLGCSAWMRVAAGRPGSSVGRADAYTLFEITALTVVLVLTVRYGAARPAAGASLLLCLAVVLRPVAVEMTENSLILALLCTFAVCAGLTGAVVARLAAADRRRHAEHVRLEQRLIFARDLHDFVAHHVTGIVVQAQGAQVVAASRPELAASALGQIERSASEALRALRHMVGGLRTEAAPVPAGGVEQLRALVGTFGLPGGGAARLDEEGPVDRLPAAAMAAVHRVVMESLTNVRKHAPDARRVTVTLRALPRSAELDIVNDRPGGAPVAAQTPATATGPPPTGYGLVGLEERVTAEGGTFRAGPDGSGQWRVETRIPWESVWRDGP
ncbi:sensor histidine kinase [Streptomyces sp. NPDC059452]|uniref:sensor histidine kinase n=1 Tax=Streptomyces sp. NPDC059452 TaxID=3346835 RepID=UPI0036BBD1CD